MRRTPSPAPPARSASPAALSVLALASSSPPLPVASRLTHSPVLALSSLVDSNAPGIGGLQSAPARALARQCRDSPYVVYTSPSHGRLSRFNRHHPHRNLCRPLRQPRTRHWTVSFNTPSCPSPHRRTSRLQATWAVIGQVRLEDTRIRRWSHLVGSCRIRAISGLASRPDQPPLVLLRNERPPHCPPTTIPAHQHKDIVPHIVVRLPVHLVLDRIAIARDSCI